MRIQHNIMAMNAYRNYNANTSALSKNLEKLSSGYKINRAGDDAAGLAISEKMRAQITGLDAAQKNVKDGISLVKTAEGAMQEIQDMLNRMVYLSEQSANGTYDNEVDRANLQKEVDQLRSEIDRIADSANFNGINLLDGSMEKGAIRGAEYTKVEASVIEKQLNDNKIGTTQNDVDDKKTILETDGSAASKPSFSIKMDNLSATDDDVLTLKIGDATYNVNVSKGDTAADIVKNFAEANATVTLTDDKGVSATFDVKADGKSLQFTGTEAKNFNPAATVSYSLANGMDPDASPEVTETTVKLTASPFTAGTPATVAASAAVTGVVGVNLPTEISIANNANAINATDMKTLADELGTPGELTVKVEGDKATLLLGDKVIGNATFAGAAAATGTNATDAGTGTLTFTAADGLSTDASTIINNIGLTVKNADEDNAFAATGLSGATIKLGVAAVADNAKAGEATFVATGTMGDTLKTLGLNGEARGDVTVKYDAGDDKFVINVDGLPAYDATLTAAGGTATLGITIDGVNTTLGTFELKKEDGTAATDVDAASLKRALSGRGMTIAQLGHDNAVVGTLDGAVQNIQLGSNGAANQLANGTLSLTDYMKQDGNKITLGDTTYTVALGKDSKFKDAKNVIDLTDMDPKNLTDKDMIVAATRLTTAAKENNGIFSVGHDNDGNTTLQQLSSAKDSTDMTTVENFASYIKIEEAKPGSLENVSTAQGLTLQIGDTSDTYNQLAVSIGDMHVSALGIDAIDISTQKGAQDAVDVIRNAINQVSSVRGDLGATQNRLEHTANNLSVMAENIQDAESTIRDTDVAQEMMAYTKNNILIQSAQAMLAQANAVPQGVLQLLG